MFTFSPGGNKKQKIQLEDFSSLGIFFRTNDFHGGKVVFCFRNFEVSSLERGTSVELNSNHDKNSQCLQLLS